MPCKVLASSRGIGGVTDIDLAIDQGKIVVCVSHDGPCGRISALNDLTEKNSSYPDAFT